MSTQNGFTILLLPTYQGKFPLLPPWVEADVIHITDEFCTDDQVTGSAEDHWYQNMRLFRSSRRNSNRDAIKLCIQSKHRHCILMQNVSDIPHVFFSDQSNGVLGISGFNLMNNGTVVPIHDVSSRRNVDMLGFSLLRVPREVFHHEIFGDLWKTRHDINIWISYVASLLDLDRIVVPAFDVSQNITLSDTQRVLASRLFLNQDEKWFSWHTFSCTKGRESQYWMSVKRPHQFDYHTLLYTLGSQRSGTTWFNQLLGQLSPTVHSLDEEDTVRFLLDNYSLLNLRSRYLALQLTFMHTQVDAIYRLMLQEARVLLMLRNPYSICWSLLYHHETLHLEWFYRQVYMRTNDIVLIKEHEELGWAISLVKHSLKAHKVLIDRIADLVHIISYDRLVMEPKSVLTSVANFTGLHFDYSILNEVNVRKISLKKQQYLAPEERAWIDQYCGEDFEALLEYCRIKKLSGSTLLWD